jgi:transcriptional regulator of acetoin/glycerol metabolism
MARWTYRTYTQGMLQPDLAHLARDLTRIHDAVITGASPPVQPRALVKRSWDRMLRLGLDPAGANRRVVDDEAGVESRRQRSRLRLVVEEMRSVLLRAPDAAPFILVVTDADGVILWRDGAASARHQADGPRLRRGSALVGVRRRHECHRHGPSRGSTEVQLFSAEHFESTQHPWYCSAVPVHDPHTGALLGIVDISGPAMTLHPAVQSLVTTAVRLAEARLMIAQQEQLNSSARPDVGDARGLTRSGARRRR